MRSLFSYLQKKNCENDEKVMPLFIQRIFKMVLRLHVRLSEELRRAYTLKK